MTRRLAIHTLLSVGVCIASVGCNSIKGFVGMSKDSEPHPVAQKPGGQPSFPPPGGIVKPPKAAGGQGKVLLVDKELGFIVADFAYSQLPPAEQKYFVYRGNQQVGEVIITGQSDETFLVADINKGDIRAGDLIRPE
jgi:hypothetical protein